MSRFLRFLTMFANRTRLSEAPTHARKSLRPAADHSTTQNSFISTSMIYIDKSILVDIVAMLTQIWVSVQVNAGLYKVMLRPIHNYFMLFNQVWWDLLGNLSPHRLFMMPELLTLERLAMTTCMADFTVDVEFYG